MTEEELEKKAEEYATEKEKNCILGVYDNTEDLQYDEGYNRGYVIGLEDGYIDGAKENGVVWHDLRKNPNDLPKRDGEYLTNIGVLVFDSSLDNRWCTLLCEACDFYEEVIDEVIAWCEIPSWREIPK